MNALNDVHSTMKCEYTPNIIVSYATHNFKEEEAKCYALNSNFHQYFETCVHKDP